MFKRKKYDHKIYPDEIFLDSKTFPVLTLANLKGGWKSPSARKLLFIWERLSDFSACSLFPRIFYLQVFEGEKFTARSERNSLKKESIIPLRGAIYDSAGTALVWNGKKGGHTPIFPVGPPSGYTGLPSKKILRKAGHSFGRYNRQRRPGKKYEKVFKRNFRGKAHGKRFSRQPCFRKRSSCSSKRPKFDIDDRLKSSNLIFMRLWSRL